MLRELNSKGFSAVELVIVMFVIAILGLGGFFVWEKNKSKPSKTDATSVSQNEQKEHVKQDEGHDADPSEGGKYLVIKEWGVRFALPEELRGDVYYKVAANEILKAEFASFASKKLDSLTGDDSCTFKNNPDNSGISASLSRSSQKILEESQPSTQELVLIRNIEGVSYYYTKSFRSPPITCLTNQHEEFNDIEQSISEQLRKEFIGLESLGNE